MRQKQQRSSNSKGTSLAVWGLTSAFVVALGFSSLAAPLQEPAPKRPGAGKQTAKAPGDAARPAHSVAGLAPEDLQSLTARFEKDLWPLMQAKCAPCHAQKNASQFVMAKDARAALLKMLGEGMLDPDNHSSVAGRVTATDKTIVMPPPSMGAFTQAEIARFTKFAEDVQKQREAGGVKVDETFPAHLTLPFAGGRKQTSPDTTFLTFRQLRGKVKTIFNDDWRRDDRDLFVENVHLFGGADFVNRFDESSKASPTFLTGVSLMARDVASRSYLARSGPFAGFPERMPSPLGVKAPAGPVAQGIDRLYQRLLFRTPTAAERAQAFALLQNVYRAQDRIGATARQDVRFRLTVKDERGMATTQDVTIPVLGEAGHALTSEFVDQSKDAADDKTKKSLKTLGRPFAFAPGDAAQRVVVYNAGTNGNVSVAAVVVRGPLPARDEKIVPVDDAAVQAEGAWRANRNDGLVSYEDNNENKGDSHLTFPVAVEEPGQYEVDLVWRRFQAPDAGKDKNGKPRRPRGPVTGAANVLVEVVSRDSESRLAVPAPPPVPPKGEAHFVVDETVDTVPYWDLRTTFRFGGGENEGIEVRNAGTRKRVVADAVRLAPASDADAAPILLKGADAAGKKQWIEFQKGTFRAYNTVGPDLYQDTDETGKRENVALLFQPAKAKKDGFAPATFYRVGLIYPGQVDNETQVPVVVRAQASSPIVRIAYPMHASVGAKVGVDASASYNLQRSPLTFRWTQTGGPRTVLADPASPRLTFTVPKMSAEQAAWEGLCRALVAHPDFLFTRPRSLAGVPDARQRRRLQLVKIAQDLVARTPTAAELAAVDAGAPMAKMVDGYLASKEFNDFYFHRVRLYLESHGTPEQDEPARVWTYIAVHDRPFKEILTADYTVDTKWRKQTRDPFHGKTGVLTTKGFIQGKPGLPHFNYPAQVLEKFMGYVFEVPDEVLNTRNGITAAATTDPNSMCYTCHKVLTPLAYQRNRWNDEGVYREHDDTGLRIDDSDQALVASYPYKGGGIEAFALQAQHKERFLRTILQTHFVWYLGREMRYETDERGLYQRLWNATEKNGYALRPLVRAIVLSPEYLNGPAQTPKPLPTDKPKRLAKLAELHQGIAR